MAELSELGQKTSKIVKKDRAGGGILTTHELFERALMPVTDVELGDVQINETKEGAHISFGGRLTSDQQHYFAFNVLYPCGLDAEIRAGEEGIFLPGVSKHDIAPSSSRFGGDPAKFMTVVKEVMQDVRTPAQRELADELVAHYVNEGRVVAAPTPGKTA